MSKIDRATLESLTAAFKGPIRKIPPAPPKLVKIKRRCKVSGGRLEAAEAAVTASAPIEEAKDATKDGTGVDLGGATRFKEADYDVASGPQDHAHRSFKMPTDKRSRAYIEMEIAAAESDGDDWTGGGAWRRDEAEIRFRTASQTGTSCGECGRTLTADEPVWCLRRKYDSTEVELRRPDGSVQAYVAEKIVAPVCGPCWDLYDRPRVSHHDPCTGCGRMVHLTPKALGAYLRHGLRVCCSEACTKRKCKECGERFEPPRQDAKFCSDRCRVAAHRRG